MKKSSSFPGLFILLSLIPALLVYVVFLLLPILESFRLSFYDCEGFTATKFVGFDNFIKLFTQFPFKERFFSAFINNIEFFLIVTILQNGVGFFTAYLITRKIWGNAFFRKISFLPTTLSVIVVGFLFKLILNPTWGIFDKLLELAGLGKLIQPWLGNPLTALPILAIVCSWQWMGEAIIFYTAGIDAIPIEIIEAARIDGAGTWDELKHIIFPSLLPVIGIVTILIFIGDFTQFDIVYSMTSSMANPMFKTDLFGSLFYRVSFQSPVRGGWGMGMGAAVSVMMSLIVFSGVLIWFIIFKLRPEKNK